MGLRGLEKKKLQRRMNPVTIKKIEEEGIDLTQPITVYNDFLIYDESYTGAILKLLSDKGFEIDGPPLDNDYEGIHYWFVDARVVLVPTVANLNELTDQCVDLADRVPDCEYDGWYVEGG